jgi:hypothetical protein
MVEAGAAVKEDDGRDLAHYRSFGTEFCALNIKEELGFTNLDTHYETPDPLL